jgi:uncharacterized protein YbaR (Trm112 family)
VFTELIDTLRCPNAHADSWLVATSTRTAERHIIDGRLGCPVCRASFEIKEGEVLFTTGSVLRTTRVLDDDAAFRLAAQLHLVEAPLPILLTGSWSRAVAPLRRIVPHVIMFVGDATSVIALDDRISTLRMPPDTIPLATGSLRGVSLDAAHATQAMLDECARVLRTGGRLVVPAGVGISETAWRTLASDSETVVAERLTASSAPVQLRRAPPQPLFEA